MASSNIKKKKRLVYISYAVLLMLIYLFEYSANISSPLGKGSFSLLVPATIISGIMFKEWAGAFYGLAVGAAIDVYSQDSFIFSTIALFVICCLVGLLITRLFLNNTFSAIILIWGATYCFYLTKWLFCTLFGGNTEAWSYLINITLPTAFFTSLAGIPLYLVIRTVYRKIVNK
ncbi:MAG: rod shape-determining protein MreD [Clostridia bacterium]|nr:rod shape-determining protein MreD [Clostridia bacterium]